jgi:glycosyltransferase involved in cell wall biosynthesis
MNHRRVIIGLPVFNGQKYLAAAIESHLSQSFGDFGLVISDNGSNDATEEICNQYARQDPRVLYLRSPVNRGILWNHRRVMGQIGDANPYFRWAGADDVLEPGLLAAMVAVLDSRPDIEAVMPATKNIDEAGSVIRTMERSLNLESPEAAARARQILLANYQHVIAYGLLRAPSLRRMRTGPNYIGWDPVFIWELALRGRIFQLVEPSLLRRFHPGSISRVKTVKEMRKWVEPDARAGMNFPHWTWAYERARSLLAAPLPAGTRLRIMGTLLRATLWQRAQLARDVTQAAKRALKLSDEYTF